MPEQGTNPILTTIYVAVPVIAAVAAVIASILMVSIRRKFGSGILAAGFRTIAIGIFCIAAGICIAALRNALQMTDPLITAVLTIIKYLLLVTGTFIIVTGSKNTGDKMESLTK